MKKLTLFIVASILFAGLTGCKHNVVTGKKLYSKTQKNEAGEIVAVTKYDKRGNVIYKTTGVSEIIYKYDSQNRIVYQKHTSLSSGKGRYEYTYEYNSNGYTRINKTSTHIYRIEYDLEGIELYRETIDLDTGDVTKEKYIKNGEAGVLSLISESNYFWVVKSFEIEEVKYPADESTEIINISYVRDDENNYIVNENNKYYLFSDDGLLLEYKYIDENTNDVTYYLSCEYDDSKNRVKQTTLDGTFVIEYDTNHNITYFVAPNGTVHQRIYDAFSNCLYRKDGATEYFWEYDENGNTIYVKIKTPETESETWQEFNSDNQITYVKVSPGSSYKEQFYEYNDMKDQIYFKQINLDDSVTETVYTYDYEYY